MYFFPNTVRAMARRLHTVESALSNPWLNTQSWWVSSHACIHQTRYERFMKSKRPLNDDGRFFRWHDSGDIQSSNHLKMIYEVARRVPQVSFWLPTREIAMVKGVFEEIPDNLTIRVSTAMINKVPTRAENNINYDRIALSGVHTMKALMRSDFEECKAYTRGGHCGPCRKCWDPKINISYKLH